LRNFDHVLVVINYLMRQAPPFNKTGLVGLPINAVLDWATGTPAGFAAFIDPVINAHLKAILNAWGAYLASPASRHVLGTDARSGWFGDDARAAMPDFEQEFECDPGLPWHGFASWDDFFTRRFRPGVRPVAAPDDDSIINNACESAPYRLAHQVDRHARFWIKAQPYSLAHMLDGHPFTDALVGGTVYQAFLSAFSYHRWHSPVNGKVVATRLVDGSYYAARPGEDFDDCAPRKSQAYITQMATRALIFIEADNPAIGLMCVMPVGMAEISTCELTVVPGQVVRKGDQLGMFHFGGSTHCLIFGPQVTLDVDLRGQTPGLEAKPIALGAALARVRAA
jgi:phosphatidylserine decarboxylase